MLLQGKKKAGGTARRGTVLTQGVIFGSVVGVGVMALAIDTGLMYTSRQELQNAADAAALAAAAKLGATDNADSLARAEAAAFAAFNDVADDDAWIDMQQDVVFGHAVLNGEKYDFSPNEAPYDAVRITVRRDATVTDGPVSLLFAKVFGIQGASLSASATAMLIPRDIAVVVDESGSMNDDSELRHYKEFPSETGGYRPGVQINLKEVWQALGSPAWGQMNAWGADIVLGSYSPTSDSGLWRIPKGAACTESAVTTQLTSRGYTSAERTALMSPSSSESDTNNLNRVKVILQLADWRSGKTGAAFSGGGDGDNDVESGELINKMNFPYPTGASHTTWDSYVSYVRGTSSRMYETDSNFRYRYGLKTIVNYLLESRGNNSNTPQLASCPEQPLASVKDAVQVMIDEIITLETQDHVSLEHFAQYGYHIHNLSIPTGGQTLADALQEIPDACNLRQAGHTTSVTNIGGGMAKAITELTSVRARSAAAKYIILLTDGKPNCNSSNTYVGDNHADAVGWALDRATAAKNQGMTVFTIGVGGDLNEQLLIDMASRPEYYFFADGSPDPDNEGQPMYVEQLKQIFQTLGGKRPVRLIQ